MLQKKVLIQTVLKLLKRMVNNLGIDPDEWFDTSEPEDLAPSSYEPPTDNRYAPPERRAELEKESNVKKEEKIDEWFVEKPDDSDEIEKEKTMHQKMYEMATARYNPFSLGGSENCDSDISCNNIGGSENLTQS